MGSEVGASVICPSIGSMFRHPLPSTGSARVRSPASSVLRNAPTPVRPSRRASFPSRDRTAPALGLRSSEPRVRGLRAWAVRSGAHPDSMTRRRSGLPGSWRTLVRTCPALRPRRARHAWPFTTCRHGLPSFLTTSALAPSYLSRLHHAASTLPCVRFAGRIAPPPRNTRFRAGGQPLPGGLPPAGFHQKVSEMRSPLRLHLFLLLQASPGALGTTTLGR